IDVSVSSSATTSAPFTVTARARDALGSPVTTYTGPATWSDNTNGLAPAAPADFVAGVSTTSVTEPDAFHGDVISVSSSGSSGSSKPFNIVGPYNHIDVTGVPASGHVGTPFTVTAYAHDAANNVVPTFETDVQWQIGTYDGGTLPFVHGVSRTTITPARPARQAEFFLLAPNRDPSRPLTPVTIRL